jgi:hypothetical protein
MQNPAKIVVGGFDALTSGTVVSYGWQPIDIYPVENIYHVRVSFESQPGQAASIFTNQLPGNETQVRLVNFDLPAGAATSAPIYVANWQGRKMYFSVASYLVGQGQTACRLTHFTFYLGEAVSV